MWFVLIVIFVMLLPKKNTFLPFSLIWKKLTTPCRNTVSCLIFTTLIFEAVCLPLLMGFCPIDGSSWELGPLCLIRMSWRWVFPKVASYLRFFSFLKLTILSISLERFRSVIVRGQFCPLYTRKVPRTCTETYATVCKQCAVLGL